MSIKECFMGSIQQLMSNKLRTFLTMLGMFIGIGSVIMVLSVGEGVKGTVMDLFSDIGKGTVQIMSKGYTRENMITQEDIDIIKMMPEVEEGILYDQSSMTVVRDYRDREKMMVVAGIPYNFDLVQMLDIVAGRNITKAEDRGNAQVVLVSDAYAESILGKSNKESILGKTIEIRLAGENHSFEVVGLVKTDTFPGMPEEMIPLVAYIPFGTVGQLLGYGEGRSFNGAVMVKDEYNPGEVAYQISRLLDKRHGTKNGFTTQALTQLVDQIDSVMGMVTAFIGLVAGISLLVGGIGIMNIMLVTVKERTREIGIRKAVGATNKEILRQFLIEAVILTILGGLIGMLFGYVGGLLVGAIAGIAVELTLSMIVFSVGVSSAIGIVFGVYPAYQASKLDPIEALRYE